MTTTTSTSSIRPTDGPAVLQVRRLHVDLAKGFDRHWHGGDAFRTQFFNALSMSFPVGEQYFIDSTREAQALLPQDAVHDALRADIRGFVGQEATHRHVHGAYNAVLERQGMVNHWQNWVRRRIAWSAHYRPINKLAITCAYEHLTAVLADGTLRHKAWLEGATQDIQTVWYWHAAEETEHRAVAFDVYQALGGGRARRIGWFVYVCAMFTAEASCQTWINLWHDRTWWQLSTWWSAFRFLAGRSGLVWRVAMPLLAYLGPGFHPNQSRTQPPAQVLAQAWLAAHADRYQVVGVLAPSEN
jgi:uncharacterized protein